MDTLKQRLKMILVKKLITFYVGIEKELIFERPKNLRHLDHLCTASLNQGWGNISCQVFKFCSLVA